MPRYFVHRALGDVTDEQLEAAAESSRRVRADQFPDIEWEHSHVVREDGRRSHVLLHLRRADAATTSATTRPPPACPPTTCR